MDDMKDKFKGFMKKVNTQLSSSSSGKFKGQGRVLGGGSGDGVGGSSSSSPAINPIQARYSHQQPPLNSKPNPNPNPNTKPSPINNSSLNSKPLPKKSSDTVDHSTPDRKPPDGFDPFDSLITTGKRSQNRYSLAVFECPICGQAFRSEEEVSIHVDTCVNNSNETVACTSDTVDDNRSELEAIVSVYLSGKRSEDSMEVILRLLRNIVKEPVNAKFRRIRLGNPKIKEAVSEVAGGIELLEFVGFEVKEEDGEMWAIMEEVPKEERIGSINKVIVLLEGGKVVDKAEDKPSGTPVESEVLVEQKAIDRQVRVFFAVPENVAAKIELPDSFYSLSIGEVKREAEMRKKKIAESQLLIPKSYKEKQAKAARKRYTRTVIRIQFPDGVVLQGVFAPWEPTTALYEFVSTALKDSSLEFELLHPGPIKRRVIPHFLSAGEKAITIDKEDLVPSALIKFRPIETDSSVFTGLCNELLEIMEPLK